LKNTFANSNCGGKLKAHWLEKVWLYVKLDEGVIYNKKAKDRKLADLGKWSKNR
jgi:hypothetical protein